MDSPQGFINEAPAVVKTDSKTQVVIFGQISNANEESLQRDTT